MYALVVDLKGKLGELERVDERFERLGQVHERVLVLALSRDDCEAEAWHVGRDDAVLVR